MLLTIDEGSYDPGSDAMGDHPIAWFHFVRSETYDDPAFVSHLLGGIRWAAARAPKSRPRDDTPRAAAR